MNRSSIVLCAATLAASCGGTHPAAEPTSGAPVAVQTVAVTSAPLADTFDAGGNVRARTVAVISSRILAPVIAVAVRPGDRVRRGQPLVRLDARQLDSGSTSADATLAGALDAAQAAAAEEAAAQSALTLATATHARISRLHERQSATAGELDDATAGLRAAEARLSGAKARRAAADRAIEASRGAARAATVTASYAVLAAPFDGLVTDAPVQEGMMAAPGVPLVTVEDTEKYRLEVSVDAARAGAIAVGSHVPVVVGDAQDAVDGTVAEVTEAIDPAGHAFVVKIDLPPSLRVRTGQFGRARFSSSERRGIAVPSSAVLRRGQLALVFTDDGGTARMRIVQIADEAGGLTRISAGLVDGDRVIVNPPTDLADGRPVTASGRNR